MNSILLSSVLMNSLFKTSFKFISFTRNSSKFGNQKFYNFKIRISSIIKLIKQKKDLQIDLNVDPEKPFDINLENILVKDSLDQAQTIHLKNYFKVLRESYIDTWVLYMIDVFMQTSLDYIHERIQMMSTDETQYFKHEIAKLMTIDEQTLKTHPELDSVVKQKYFGINPTNPHSQQRHPHAHHMQQIPGGMVNPQKIYQINHPNQMTQNQQPNQLPPRSQSGSQYPQNQHQMHMQYQQNMIQQPQQLHSHPSQYFQAPPNGKPPIQNAVQPLPNQIPGTIQGQDNSIRQRQGSVTSQSGSMGQITPTNQNTQIPRSFHQQQGGMIQNPQNMIIPQNQHIQQPLIHQQYGANQIRPQKQVLINNPQQSPAIVPQNPQLQPPLHGHQMGQPPLPQPHLHQQQSQPPHPSLQQPPVGGIQQPILNNAPPSSGIQPSFDPNIPNIGPNTYGQHPQGIQSMVPRSNHPIAPKNY